LRLLHGWLLTSEEAAPALSVLLTRLARAFDGLEAGLALGTLKTQMDADGRSVIARRGPWEERAELLEQAGRAPTAVSTPGHDRTNWLWTVLEMGGNQPCIVWLAGPVERTWSTSEAAVLPLAAQALLRLVGSGFGSASLTRTFERARLQGKLEAAAALTSRLAHDFGNVLTGILGFAELSISQLPPDSLPRRYVEEIWQAAQQGARWIQKLQMFSRRRSQPFLPATLPMVVAPEKTRLGPLWEGRVELRVTVPEDLPALGLDAESLREILSQLLDNAGEAFAAPGVVTLAARTVDLSEQDCQELLGNAAPGAHVEVTITDSGSGFSAEARQRLFVDPFFSNKPRHRGLGLAVVYGLLQSSRGGLRFGPHPDQGTTVRVLLPIARAEEPSPAPTTAKLANGDRVLVVDDDTLTVRFITSVLESAGYQVQGARSAAEAQELYGSGTPGFDLVLTDVVMPQQDGFDLVRVLQKRDPRLNVLFMSCRQDGQDWPQDSVLRDHDLLLKPFRPEGLLRAVRAALHRGRNGRGET
jgi:signal transduction histidine kinase/CheY-like chemotaxis protein